MRAALSMQAAMAEWSRGRPLRLRTRIGINTGLMIAGDLHGPVVREFAVMGDAVNVAARLKELGAAAKELPLPALLDELQYCGFLR